MNWIKKNLLTFLLGLAVVCLIASIALYKFSDSPVWKVELAKALMGLSFTAIFGGVIKLVFDKYQEDKKHDEKSKEFKAGIVNHLRKVFDSVDIARLLIEAHRSAKTYGEKMRENIIPSITSLYDIKRSLVDSQKVIGKESLPLLRLSLHYMIAYLTDLSEEYKHEYPAISNDQFFQEAVRERVKKLTVDRVVNEDNFVLDSKTPIPQPSEFTWNRIKDLKDLKDFLSNDRKASYYRLFIEHYEYCKDILKEIIPLEDIRKPCSFNDEYLAFLKNPDEDGKVQAIQDSHNLVARIRKENPEYSLKHCQN